MHTIVSAVAAALLLALASGCGPDHRSHAAPPPPATREAPPGRGAVLATVPLGELDAGQVRGALAGHGLDTSRVRYGVTARRVEYATVGPGRAPHHGERPGHRAEDGRTARPAPWRRRTAR